MYTRILKPEENQSYFFLGPRGTGKSSWLKEKYPKSSYIDLLDHEIFNVLNANPKELINYIHTPMHFVIIDEVQKIPHLLDEVHRLIESKKFKFILTGSSARKLKSKSVNLLGGRALTYHMHPLTSTELGKDFDLLKNLQYGFLPIATTSKNPKKFLSSYIHAYLKEEVQLEGLTRNMPAFSRFLQAASFSQASPLNVSAVASDCGIERKVVEDYFSILRDLMISFELPIFSKRAKRSLITKSKFFFFDCGVFRALRPRGPLDSDTEINGAAFETLIIQNIRALNELCEWEFALSYWHSRKHEEVDLILYGPKGLFAIEVKSSARLRNSDFDSLELFKSDYPMAKCFLVYGGKENRVFKSVQVLGAESFFNQIGKLFGS